MRSPLRRAAAAALALIAFVAPAPALDKAADRKAAEAAEKSFLEAYTAAGTDEKARAKVIDSLSSAPDAVKTSALLGKVLPKDDSPAVYMASVAVLRRVTSTEGIEALSDAAAAKGSWNVRGAAIESLGGTSAPDAVAALRSLLKSQEAKVVAAAVFSLAEGRSKDVLEDVKKVVDHSQWQVRLAALDYLGRLRDAATVPLLVDRLEEETGRLQMEVVEALKAVTGKDYGKDALKWRAYAQGGDAAAKEAGPKPGDKPDAGGGGGRVAVATGAAPIEPTYYGQKVYSDRVVFVIDVSLSMNLEMEIDRDTLVRETGAVVSGGSAEGGAPPPDPKKDGEVIPIEWWKIKTRLDFAKSQLKYVVSTLKRDQHFDLVWFGEEVGVWAGRMVPAQPAIKVKAANWIDELKENGPREGGTNSWGGLMKALNLVGKGTDEENYGKGADTLYFMSDGQPTCGDIKDEAQILAAIERIHKVRRVKINVVQIGTSPLPFMKRLAAVTGAEYKFFNAKAPK